MKKKSRQQQWQGRQKKKGKCSSCGKPLFTKWHCKECAMIQRTAARARYRSKNGLDINALLIKTGRKKTEEA